AALDPGYPLPAAVADTVAAAPAQADERPPLALLRDGLQAGQWEGLAALARLCSAAELGSLLHDPALRLQPQVLAWLLDQGADADLVIDGETALSALLGQGGEGAAAKIGRASCRERGQT